MRLIQWIELISMEYFVLFVNRCKILKRPEKNTTTTTTKTKMSGKWFTFFSAFTTVVGQLLILCFAIAIALSSMFIFKVGESVFSQVFHVIISFDDSHFTQPIAFAFHTQFSR